MAISRRHTDACLHKENALCSALFSWPPCSKNSTAACVRTTEAISHTGQTHLPRKAFLLCSAVTRCGLVLFCYPRSVSPGRTERKPLCSSSYAYLLPQNAKGLFSSKRGQSQTRLPAHSFVRQKARKRLRTLTLGPMMRYGLCICRRIGFIEKSALSFNWNNCLRKLAAGFCNRICRPDCLPHLPIAGHHPFFRHQFFQCKRSPGVQFLSGDADLGTKAEFFAVGKAGR